MIPYNNGNTYKTLAAAKKAAGDNSFVAEYGITTYDELNEAYEAGKHIILKYVSGGINTYYTTSLRVIEYEGETQYSFTALNYLGEYVVTIKSSTQSWVSSYHNIPSSELVSELQHTVGQGYSYKDGDKFRNIDDPKFYYNIDDRDALSVKSIAEGYKYLTTQLTAFDNPTQDYMTFSEWAVPNPEGYFPYLFFSTTSNPQQDSNQKTACKQLIQMAVRGYYCQNFAQYPTDNVLYIPLIYNTACLGNAYDLTQLYKELHPEYDATVIRAIMDGEPYTREKMVTELSTTSNWNNRENIYGNVIIRIIKPDNLSWSDLMPENAYVTDDILNNNAIEISITWEDPTAQTLPRNILSITTNNRSANTTGDSGKSISNVNDLCFILRGGYLDYIYSTPITGQYVSYELAEFASGTRPIGKTAGSAGAYTTAFRAGWNIYGSGRSWDEYISTATATSGFLTGYTPSVPGLRVEYKKLAFKEDIPQSAFDVRLMTSLSSYIVTPKNKYHIQLGENDNGMGHVWFDANSSITSGELGNNAKVSDIVTASNAVANAPTSDGNYVLKCTVTGGVPTYTWVAE